MSDTPLEAYLMIHAKLFVYGGIYDVYSVGDAKTMVFMCRSKIYWEGGTEPAVIVFPNGWTRYGTLTERHYGGTPDDKEWACFVLLRNLVEKQAVPYSPDYEHRPITEYLEAVKNAPEP